MGSSPSRQLHKALRSSDESEARAVIRSNPGLLGDVGPSHSYGEQWGHNTPLHYAALAAMPTLVPRMLEKGGLPNAVNAKGWTALHCAVARAEEAALGDRELVIDALASWRGSAPATGGVPEFADMNAVNEDGDTCLHVAARAGLLRCAEMILYTGGFVFAENAVGQTAADVASESGHATLASRLEGVMVFGDHPQLTNSPSYAAAGGDAAPAGVRFHRERSSSSKLGFEAVDMALRVTRETSFRTLSTPEQLLSHKRRLVQLTQAELGVDSHTASALLGTFRWDRETAVTAFFADPAAACRRAKVDLPRSARSTSVGLLVDRTAGLADDDQECCICMDEVSLEAVSEIPCGHVICTPCWKDYLETAIASGDVAQLQCPAYKCPQEVPAHVISSVLPEPAQRRMQELTATSFVDGAARVKWCPQPGCGLAVVSPKKDTARTVCCEAGHSFCWICAGEPHEPCPCDLWKRWSAKVTEMTGQGPEGGASSDWLLSHTKPCPECDSPIEKNDGCNHMTCRICKHEWCWMCRLPWSEHGAATGGFYRCNREDDIAKAKEELRDRGGSRADAAARFKHCYARHSNHRLSAQLEQSLLPAVAGKRAALEASTPHRVDAAFLTDAVQELLRSRSVLCNSYAFLFFLSGGFERLHFLHKQAALERIAERLAELVVRPVLKSPRKQILRVTAIAQRARQDFVAACQQGLIAQGAAAADISQSSDAGRGGDSMGGAEESKAAE